jgi:hypothetical protein
MATFHPAVAALLDRFHAHAYLSAPLRPTAPRTKPGAVIRPGLDILLKDIPLYMNPGRKLHFAWQIASGLQRNGLAHGGHEQRHWPFRLRLGFE